MPRNQSEKIPHPELPKAFHEYYKVRVKSRAPTDKSERLWHRLSRENQNLVRDHWNTTPEHNALKAYYRYLPDSDGT